MSDPIPSIVGPQRLTMEISSNINQVMDGQRLVLTQPVVTTKTNLPPVREEYNQPGHKCLVTVAACLSKLLKPEKMGG